MTTVLKGSLCNHFQKAVATGLATFLLSTGASAAAPGTTEYDVYRHTAEQRYAQRVEQVQNHLNDRKSECRDYLERRYGYYESQKGLMNNLSRLSGIEAALSETERCVKSAERVAKRGMQTAEQMRNSSIISINEREALQKLRTMKADGPK